MNFVKLGIPLLGSILSVSLNALILSKFSCTENRGIDNNLYNLSIATLFCWFFIIGLLIYSHYPFSKNFLSVFLQSNDKFIFIIFIGALLIPLLFISE